MKDKLPSDDLKDIPFPDCASKCLLVEYLGVCECESACSYKFERNEDESN